MYKLVIQDDEGKTTVVPLIRDELTIGRKEGNTIRLTERNVSRQHARLTRSNSTIVIEDLNSYNGIRVNGSRIQGRATIKESDRVQIGDYLIEVRSDAAVEAGKGNGSQDETKPLERLDASAPPTTPMAAAEAPSAAPMAQPAPVPEVVALADTDPGRAASPAVSNHGRLVILSTNFAGQEFSLDKAKMVIGRTDDNDIWINHRSISRHHAKVMLENGRFSIEDLQSSNGVRVNGEEYGKVELRRADVIDLGHVRLRFVEPGEDFVFGRDAQPVEVYPDGGGRTWLWIALAVSALAGAVALFMMMGNDGKATGVADAGVTVAQRSDGPTAHPVTPDAAVVPEVVADAAPVPDPGAELNELLDKAKAHVAKKEWQAALAAVQKVRNLNPANEEAKAIEEQANAELAATKVLAQLQAAARAGNYDQVRDLTAQIASTSRGPAAAKIEAGAKRSQQRRLGREARRASARHECDRFNHIANSASWPDVRHAVRRIGCKEKVVTNNNGNDSGSGSGSGSNTGNDDNGGTQPTTADYQNWLQAALQGSGSIKKGYEACDKLGGVSNLRRCVMLGCTNRNEARAKRYFNRIRSQSGKSGLPNMCLTKGIRL